MSAGILDAESGWLTSVSGLFSCFVALQWWMDSVKYFVGMEKHMHGDASLCDTTVLNSVTWNCQITANSGLLINSDMHQHIV